MTEYNSVKIKKFPVKVNLDNLQPNKLYLEVNFSCNGSILNLDIHNFETPIMPSHVFDLANLVSHHQFLIYRNH